MIEWAYTGSLCVFKAGHASPDLVADVKAAAAAFQVGELETYVFNYESGNHDLNPSFTTYVSENTGRNHRELFLQRPRFADVRVALTADAEGARERMEVPAHTAIMASRSEFFAAAIGRWQRQRPGAEKKEEGGQGGAGSQQQQQQLASEVLLSGVPPAVCRALLEFLYTDTVTFETNQGDAAENVDPFELIVYADQWGLGRLLSLCELRVTKVVEASVAESIANADVDVVGLLRLADAHNARQLVNWCLHFIASNYEPMSKREDFKFIPKEYKAVIEKNQWPPMQYKKAAGRYLEEMKAWKRDTGKRGGTGIRAAAAAVCESGVPLPPCVVM